MNINPNNTLGNMPQHHPDFILELLILAEYDLLEAIMKKIIKQVKKKNSVSNLFSIGSPEIYLSR